MRNSWTEPAPPGRSRCHGAMVCFRYETALMKRLLLWVALTRNIGALQLQDWQHLARRVEATTSASAGRIARDTNSLTQYHYKAVPLDDSMSARIFDNYLKALDPDRRYFLQSDVDHLSRHRNDLDDAIAGEDLSVPFAIFNRFTQRVSEQFAYAHSLLNSDSISQK